MFFYKSFICLFLFGLFYYILYNQVLKNFEFKTIKLINKMQALSFYKYVAISTSLEFEKDFYMFYLPVTCQSWRRIGYEPIIIIVINDFNAPFLDLLPYNYYNESQINNKQISANLTLLQLKVIEYLNRLKVRIFYMRSFKDYESQIAMLARVFIGYISKKYIANDNDYIILSDTDLIPIKHSYYEYNYTDERITLWNNNFAHFEFNHEKFELNSMSHIGMKKYMWKNILTYDIKFNKFFNILSTEIKLDRTSIIRIINELFKQNRFVINSKLSKINLYDGFNLLMDLTDAQNSTTETQNKNLRRKIKNTKISQNVTNKIKLLKSIIYRDHSKFFRDRSWPIFFIR